jgi:hypothetical protein
LVDFAKNKIVQLHEEVRSYNIVVAPIERETTYEIYFGNTEAVG